MVAKKLDLHTKAERGLGEAIAYLDGNREGYRVTEVEVPQVDIKVIRKRLDLTQSEFSTEFGIPLATLKNWEQGHRQPEGAARLFFKLIEQDPEEMRRRVGKVLAGA